MPRFFWFRAFCARFCGAFRRQSVPLVAFFGLACSFMGAIPAAALDVTEPVSLPTYWGIQHSPVHVYGNFVVEADATLWVQAGVEIFVYPTEEAPLPTWTAEGNVYFDGEIQSPILISGAPFFAGVELRSGNPSRIAHLQIEQAELALHLAGDGDVTLSSLRVRDCKNGLRIGSQLGDFDADHLDISAFADNLGTLYGIQLAESAMPRQITLSDVKEWGGGTGISVLPGNTLQLSRWESFYAGQAGLHLFENASAYVENALVAFSAHYAFYVEESAVDPGVDHFSLQHGTLVANADFAIFASFSDPAYMSVEQSILYGHQQDGIRLVDGGEFLADENIFFNNGLFFGSDISTGPLPAGNVNTDPVFMTPPQVTQQGAPLPADDNANWVRFDDVRERLNPGSSRDIKHRFAAPYSGRMRLHLGFADTDSGFDTLTLYGCPTETAPVVDCVQFSQYSGQVSTTTSPETDAKYILARFQSDSANPSVGYRIDGYSVLPQAVDLRLQATSPALGGASSNVVDDVNGRLRDATPDIGAVEFFASSPPVVYAGADRFAFVGQTSTYAAEAFDDDGSISSLVWNMGDGVGSATSAAHSYAYAAAGEYEVSVLALDNTGASARASFQVVVVENQNPTAVLTPPARVVQGQPAVFSAHLSTDPDGAIAFARFSSTISQQAGPSAEGLEVALVFDVTGLATVELEVEDAAGATDVASIQIDVQPSIDDAGMRLADAGARLDDAGTFRPFDAGQLPGDAGAPFYDAGIADAGTADAGILDAGPFYEADAGDEVPLPPAECGCATSDTKKSPLVSWTFLLFTMFVLLLSRSFIRRSRREKSIP